MATPGATIDGLLDRALRDTGDAPAVIHAGGAVGWPELDARARALERELTAGAGERVAIVAPNSPALVAALFAVWRRGAVAVPLSARVRRYEIERALTDSGAVELVGVHSRGGNAFGELAPELFDAVPTLARCVVADVGGRILRRLGSGSAAAGEPARLAPEIAAILYTSGSTGEPKGVLVAHESELAGADSTAWILDARAGEPAIFVVPITHAFGLIALLATVAARGTAVMVEPSPSPSPAPLLEAIATTGARLLHGSPTLFAALVKGNPERLGMLRTGLVAGAHCPPTVLEQLDAAGVRLLNLYGMTELGAASSCRLDDPALVRHTTVGRPLPGYEMRVSDGEVQVRSPHVTPGYHGRPEATAAAFEGDWLRTGDVGSIDDAGNLVLEGRRKELVNVAGFNVYPSEVEGFLTTHPDVAQAAVVGIPHERMGEVLRAWVVLRPGASTTQGELVRFARAGIAGHKVPYGIAIVDDMPLLASGKPDRRALAQRAGKEAAGAAC